MAIFPGAVATDANLYIAVDNLSTLLTDNPLTSGATTVNVADATLFPTVGFISIDAEIILYTGKTATSFTGCTRGVLGTIAASHVLNSQVDHNVVSAHHNANKDEIIAIETFIQTHFGLTTNVLATEFEFLDGVTSNIQTQLNLKAPLASPVFTGVVTIPTPFTLGVTSVTTTGAELNFVAGVTSAIQTQLNAKAADTLVVHLAGTETLTGQKTFSLATLHADGTIALPGIAFASDTDTGIFRSSTNAFVLVTGGAAKLDIQPSAVVSSVTHRFQDGAAATPSINFDNDNDTGIYRVTTDTIGFTAGGIVRATISTTALDIGSTIRILNTDGTAALPSYGFGNDLDTGLFLRSGGNGIGFAFGGTLRATLNSTGFSVDSGTLQILDGTVSSPALQFGADPDTGIYRPAANQLDITAAGARVVRFDGATGNIWANSSSSASPSYSFNSSTNVGMYNGGTTLGFAVPTAGDFEWRVNSVQIIQLTSTNFLPVGAGTVSTGTAANYWNDVSYKTLTDRGCLPWCDTGVELQDGTFVSDLEALCAIEKHPTELTIQGLPKLNYATFPKKAYIPAAVDGELLPRDENNLPIGGSDGVEMTMIFGVMIGAFKQLKAENDALKARLDALEAE